MNRYKYLDNTFKKDSSMAHAKRMQTIREVLGIIQKMHADVDIVYKPAYRTSTDKIKILMEEYWSKDSRYEEQRKNFTMLWTLLEKGLFTRPGREKIIAQLEGILKANEAA